MIKISRPLPKRVTPRPRLFERLDALRSSPAVWISANAGAGKTSLVSSYIESRRIPCLWYQLDKDDSDLGGFFYYLGRAAAKAAAQEPSPLPLFTPEYLHGIPAFARRYFECLYSCFAPPFLLVLDNYQEVPQDSALHEIINRALLCLPEGMNAIIISRCDPPALFIRQQANSNLALLRWEHLRLTEQEALDIFVQRDKELFSIEVTRHLHQLADGWAAGLVLMAQLAQPDTIDVQHLENLSQEHIFAYFTHEVFASLDAATREFLVKTALLPTMTAQMAAELTAHPDAAEMLRTLVRNNFFTVRHAEAGYSYHPLFRDFLLAHAPKVLPPETLLPLHRHAADLLAQTDQLDAALNLLKDIADWQRIADILLGCAPEMLKQGRHRSLQEWFNILPDKVVENNPWLLYWKGMSSLPQTPREAQACFERAFLLFQADHQPVGAVLAASGITNTIVLGYEDFTPLGHWFTVLNDLVDSMQTFPNDETEAWVTASMVTALGILETPHPDAESWVKRALALKETPATINPKIHALYQLFWYQGVNRGMNGLFPLLQEMQRLACSSVATPHAQLMVKLANTQYYEETVMHSECLQAVDDALVFAEKFGIPLYGAALNNMAVASCLNRMDIKAAQERLEQMRPYLAEAKPWSGSAMHHQFARAALIRKKYDQARYHAEQAFRLGSPLGSPFITGCHHWMMAQVLHRLDRKQEALDHLAHCFAIVDQFGTRWVAVMAHLFDAQFSFDHGDKERGLQALRACLETARKGGYLLTCLDDPRVTIQMCEKALEAGIEVEHVQKIIRTRGLFPEKPPVHIENWPWPVRVYTLGRFSLVRDDKPMQPGKKAQQMPLRLLKLLIALGGREVAEERLANVLWPDADGDMAHHAFETTLLRLRKLLGYPKALRFREGKLTLDNRFCWVDIWAFERLLGQADERLAHKQLDGALHALEKAASLYRGSFLAGEEIEPWKETTAERLQRKYVRGAMRLGRCLDSAGRGEKAAALYERCLDVDETNEDVSRNLMICHKKLGNTSAAVSVYLRCQKVLSSRLGISPSAETEAIRTSLG